MSDPKRKYGADAYRQNELLTANKETVLLLLYAGAIRFLKQAMDAMEKKKLAEKAKYIIKTQEIVGELRAGLNFEVGGEIAVNLERLYDYIIERLVQGNLQNSTKPLEEALNVLNMLNETWEEAVASLRKEKAAEK
ncbi:flagellar export chaperone FliS [bacterium]|nr:flagellar export chaperone FliS [bacterium]